MVQQMKQRGRPKGSRNCTAAKPTMEDNVVAPLSTLVVGMQSSPLNPSTNSPSHVNRPVHLGNSDFPHCGLKQAAQPANLVVDDLIVALRNSEVCNLSDDSEALFERIWQTGLLNLQTVSLRSDNNCRLHVPLFDLGLCGKSCIVPRHELPELMIDESSGAFSLDYFWGIVIVEFYDPSKAIDMIDILLCGP